MRSAKIKGGLAAATAFLLWGILPLFWKALASLPALEVIAHRVVWTSLLLVTLLVVTGQGRVFQIEFRSFPRGVSHLVRALLLGTNWVIYFWSVSHDRILEVSLGYFLVPLMNVALGVVFLKERLNLIQTLAVGLAAAGVSIFAINSGGLPWVSLGIALSFGFYGLLRKKATVGALGGATIETSILLPVAVAWLVLLEVGKSGTPFNAPASINLLLMGTGIVTAIPLVLFGYSSRRITLASLGVFQYLAPSAKFILGLWVYHEPFTSVQMIGFILIWTALAIYSWNGLRGTRRRPPAILPE